MATNKQMKAFVRLTRLLKKRMTDDEFDEALNEIEEILEPTDTKKGDTAAAKQSGEAPII